MSEIVSKYIECYVYRRVNNIPEFLLLKRSNYNKTYPGIWQIVTGTITEGEKAYETAIREVNEETGLIPVDFYCLPEVGSFYHKHNDTIHLIPLFLARTIDYDVRISDEHTEFRWCDVETSINLIHWQTQKKILKSIKEFLEDENLFSTLVKVK